MLRYGSLLFTSAIALTPVCAAAQSPARSDIHTAYVADPTRPTDTADPEIYLARGQRELEAWNLSAAGRDFARALRLQRSTGAFPERALWGLATLAHIRGDVSDAARHLDDLAAEAETHGRPDIAAKALLEAAVMHQQLGARQEVRVRLDRLQPLLESSPFLGDSLRQAIRERIHP